ncbi:hypothetical protein EDB80DRAFT_628014 [Ilyonectria destructans]|nr:hypothetical protein EDB80DRAFT_628014 [Ilyonectria destructans]
MSTEITSHSSQRPSIFQPTARQLDRLQQLSLHLNHPEPAIICIPCGFALKADGERVSRHLGEAHEVAELAQRCLNSLVRSLKLPDPVGLPPRPSNSTPHPQLTLQKGITCKHCGLRSVSRKVMVGHVRKDHRTEIRATARLKGASWIRDHVEEGVFFQSWCAKDVRRSWIVRPEPAQAAVDGTVPLPYTEAAPEPVQNLADQLRLEEEQYIEQQSFDRHQHHLPASGTPDARLLSNWLRRTGWERTFDRGGGARKDLLVALSELPRGSSRPLYIGDYEGRALQSSADDEGKLALIAAAVDRLFDICGDTTIHNFDSPQYLTHTDVSIRRWLRGIYPDRPYRVPFELVTRTSSEKVYRKEYKRYVCFWLRLWRLPYTTAKSITRRGFSQDQAAALSKLWEDPLWEAEHIYVDHNEEEDEDSDTDDDDTDDSEDDDTEDDDTDDEETENPAETGESSPDNSIWPSDDQEAARGNDPAADMLLRLFHLWLQRNSRMAGQVLRSSCTSAPFEALLDHTDRASYVQPDLPRYWPGLFTAPA